MAQVAAALALAPLQLLAMAQAAVVQLLQVECPQSPTQHLPLDLALERAQEPEAVTPALAQAALDLHQPQAPVEPALPPHQLQAMAQAALDLALVLAQEVPAVTLAQAQVAPALALALHPPHLALAMAPAALELVQETEQ
jgi:hypothetical protein